MTLTGAQIEHAAGAAVDDADRRQRSGSCTSGCPQGFAYSWSASAPVGQQVDPASITLNGAPIDPAATYRVTVNSFLADGGDGSPSSAEGTDRMGGGVDLDAFIAYLTANSPVTAPPTRATPLPKERLKASGTLHGLGLRRASPPKAEPAVRKCGRPGRIQRAAGPAFGPGVH